MEVWDKLCTVLHARKVSVEDVSSKVGHKAYPGPLLCRPIVFVQLLQESKASRLHAKHSVYMTLAHFL